jgi:Helicase associated domain
MRNQIRSWEENYEALMEYRVVHGDCMVPLRFAADKILGKWVSTQRESRYVLKPERKELLDRIGFEWYPRQRRSDDKWNGMFERLLTFRQQSRNISQVFNYCQDPELVKWCCNQREYSGRSLLAEERYQRLRDIGFPVRPLQKAVLAKRDDGRTGGASSPESVPDSMAMSATATTNKPQAEYTDNASRRRAFLPTTPAALDDSCITQRTAAAKVGQFLQSNLNQQTAPRTNSVLHERTEAAQSDPPSSLSRRRSWLESYAALVDFKSQLGHCRVPVQYKHDKQLGIWVSEQRKKKFLMSYDRREKLEQLGFTWANPRGNLWTTMFNKLKEYRMENPESYKPKNFNLRNWLEGQKHAVLERTLHKDYVEQLRSIGYNWQNHRPQSPEASDASLTTSSSQSSQGSLGAEQYTEVASRRPLRVPPKKRRVTGEPREPLATKVVSPENPVAAQISYDKSKGGAAIGAAESRLFLAGTTDRNGSHVAEDMCPPQKRRKSATALWLHDVGVDSLTEPQLGRFASNTQAFPQQCHPSEPTTIAVHFGASQNRHLTTFCEQSWNNEAKEYDCVHQADDMVALEAQGFSRHPFDTSMYPFKKVTGLVANSTAAPTNAEIQDICLADIYLSQVGKLDSGRR